MLIDHTPKTGSPSFLKEPAKAFSYTLSPRTPRLAQLWAATSLVVGMFTNLVVQWLASPDGTNLATLTAMVIAGLAAGFITSLPAVKVAPFLVLVPLLGVAMIVRLDLHSGDAGVTGQIFFVIPAVWAAAHLRVGGVLVVILATVAGESAVVFSILPPADALVDGAYVSILVTIIAAVLGRASAHQEALRQLLSQQANRDTLTGLASRRALDAELKRLQSLPTMRASLVLLDLDHFKKINDTHGHSAGDAALIHVARLAQNCCRDGDLVARLGGDELAMLLTDISPEAARERAKLVVETVKGASLVLRNGVPVTVTLSAGVAPLASSFRRETRNAYELADEALYAAKRAGRGRAAFNDGQQGPPELL